MIVLAAMTIPTVWIVLPICALVCLFWGWAYLEIYNAFIKSRINKWLERCRERCRDRDLAKTGMTPEEIKDFKKRYKELMEQDVSSLKDRSIF